LVTISKLNALASVEPDIGLFSFVLLMFVVTVASVNFDARSFWKQVDELQELQVKVC